MITVAFLIGSAFGGVIGWWIGNHIKEYMRLQADAKASSEN